MRGRMYGVMGFLSIVVTATAWLMLRGPRARQAPVLDEVTAQAPEPPRPAGSGDAKPTPRLWVLAINGGGSVRENYFSHLQHLQGLVDLLHQAGVPADRITVLAGDGSDPTPDLAVRVENDGAEYWRLRGTPVDGKLLPRLEVGNSAVTGATLYPATRGSLSIWTLTVGQQLRAGDTLLLYVTDHGTRGTTLDENRIVLWGPGQGLSVNELRETLETLDARVRVVALMSQCFSGGFATLLSLGGAKGEATGRFCGFFSAREWERSYGCYPETRSDPKVGHSFMFLQALPATSGRFALAHELVVERDDTPDQPLRTSDLYLHRLFDKAARAGQRSKKALADELLRAAWARPGVFDGQRQRVDRLATRFGFSSPRSHADVAEARDRLQSWQSRLDEANQKLGRTLDALNAQVFRRFTMARREWLTTLSPAALEAMPPAARMQLGATLVAELAAFGVSDTQGQTQAAANAMVDAAGQLAYRMKVRLAALDRMAFVLDSVAAAQYLAEHAEERAAREGLDRLLACEDLALPVPQRAWPSPAPLPTLEDDLAQVEMILALTAVENRGEAGGEERGKPSPLRLGESMPALGLLAYRGQVPAIGAGAPVLLFFWATWCKPCKAVLPELMSVAAKRKLTVLAIASENQAELDRFFATAPSFPELVARDPEARVPRLLGVQAIPSFVLVDGQGHVASKIVHSPRELPENLGER